MLIFINSFQKSIEMHLYHHNGVTLQILANSTTKILHEGNFCSEQEYLYALYGNHCRKLLEVSPKRRLCIYKKQVTMWIAVGNLLYGNSLKKLLSNPAEFTALRDGTDLWGERPEVENPAFNKIRKDKKFYDLDGYINKMNNFWQFLLVALQYISSATFNSCFESFLLAK
jgi:hypothetical protein